MRDTITQSIHTFLLKNGPATPERVAEVIPQLATSGGAQHARLLMRLDPALESTGKGRWAARGAAIPDERRVLEAAERYFSGLNRPGAPLSSTVRAVMAETGLTEPRVRALLQAEYVVNGTNIFNRKR